MIIIFRTNWGFKPNSFRFQSKYSLVVVGVCSVASDSLWSLDSSPPDSSVHGIFQARLVWVSISFSRASSWLRDQTFISCIGRWILLPLCHLGVGGRFSLLQRKIKHILIIKDERTVILNTSRGSYLGKTICRGGVWYWAVWINLC